MAGMQLPVLQLLNDAYGFYLLFLQQIIGFQLS